MKKIDLNNKKIIISRTDSIGDVVLTLPLCYFIKENFTNCEIHFLGQTYTRPVLDFCSAIDEVHAWDEIEKLPVQARHQAIKNINADCFLHVFPTKRLAKIAKKAEVPLRIGTSHRPYNLLNCTHRLNFTRKSANEHESQLNFHLLKPFGVDKLPSFKEVKELLSKFKNDVSTNVNSKVKKLLEGPEKKVILHPMSKGSALEWPIEKFIELSDYFVQKGYKVYLTGTEGEGKTFRKHVPKEGNVEDLSGKLDLKELIQLTANVDGLIACSTGPLHIAAAVGTNALGLYLDKRPIHPGRWMPIGKNAHFLAQSPLIIPKDEEIKTLNFKPEIVFKTFLKLSK